MDEITEISTDGATEFGIRDNRQASGAIEDNTTSLCRRTADDPMTLYEIVRTNLKNYFLNSGLTILSSQQKALSKIAESILSASPGTITAVPLVPGGGKSTLIRALLVAFATTFKEPTSPIAKKIGGIIVVVEKTSEAHELELLCNNEAGQRVAAVIESPNDYNLRNGCPNGTATRYEECPRRACPDYRTCPLVQAAGQTEETPILILLHARYQRHVEDMTPFLTWYCDEEAYHRTLLLVDELPSIYDNSLLCISSLNDAEAELDQLKASYRPEQRAAKRDILYHWNKAVRTPFFKLSHLIQKTHILSGLVSEEMKADAGFQPEELKMLQKKLAEYANDTKVGGLVDALLSGRCMYHSTDQTFTTFVPRLKKIDTASQLAVFIFSGTATLSPELTGNPDVTMLADASFDESYSRLTITAQQGNGFSASKTALDSRRNLAGLVTWLRALLPILAERHQKILVVTYKQFSEQLWCQLSEFRDILIPYIDSENMPVEKLPYFGGMNGSNKYQEATCVVCVGINRFEPGEYLNRALALDFTGETARQIAAEEGRTARYDRVPGVRTMEHITLARDLVQLVFRSALRRHGDHTPIEFWLMHPPDGVLEHVRQYFGDCRIETVPELPESCRRLATTAREYKGAKTHAAVLLHCLEQCAQEEITPAELREQTGLSQSQYKEAMKNEVVRAFLHDNFDVSGSGKHTRYRLKAAPPATA